MKIQSHIYDGKMEFQITDKRQRQQTKTKCQKRNNCKTGRGEWGGGNN